MAATETEDANVGEPGGRHSAQTPLSLVGGLVATHFVVQAFALGWGLQAGILSTTVRNAQAMLAPGQAVLLALAVVMGSGVLRRWTLPAALAAIAYLGLGPAPHPAWQVAVVGEFLAMVLLLLALRRSGVKLSWEAGPRESPVLPRERHEPEDLAIVALFLITLISAAMLSFHPLAGDQPSSSRSEWYDATYRLAGTLDLCRAVPALLLVGVASLLSALGRVRLIARLLAVPLAIGVGAIVWAPRLSDRSLLEGASLLAFQAAWVLGSAFVVRRIGFSWTWRAEPVRSAREAVTGPVDSPTRVAWARTSILLACLAAAHLLFRVSPLLTVLRGRIYTDGMYVHLLLLPLCQASLLGFWLALGGGRLPWRALGAAAGTVGYLWFVRQLDFQAPESRLAWPLSAEAGLLLGVLLFLAARLAGLELTPPSRAGALSPQPRHQFHIQDLLILTAAIALLLGIIHYQPTRLLWEFLKANPYVAAGLTLLIATATWAPLARGRWVPSAAAALTLAAIVVSHLARRRWDYALDVEAPLVTATLLSGSAAVLRLAGYRWAWRGQVSRPEDATRLDKANLNADAARPSSAVSIADAAPYSPRSV